MWRNIKITSNLILYKIKNFIQFYVSYWGNISKYVIKLNVELINCLHFLILGL